MEVPEPNGLNSSSAFLFQQVSRIREGLIKGTDWDKLADKQIQEIFIMTDATDRDLTKMADLYSDELSENVLEPPAVAIP